MGFKIMAFTSTRYCNIVFEIRVLKIGVLKNCF